MTTTSRGAVIAAEQEAVDHAYACYESALADMGPDAAAAASASGKDSVAVRRAAEARVEAYGGLDGEALVISRVDVHESNAQPETWYIGRRLVRDANGDIVVVSWTDPTAAAWRSALPESPGDVRLRRQLRCTERLVEDYFDEIVLDTPAAVARRGERAEQEDWAEDPTGSRADDRGDASGVGTGPEETASLGPERARVPSPRDVGRQARKKPRQVDEYLLRELHRSRSGRMRDIVETIRRDQMALVTDDPTGVLVVQGGPGTGKSAVGLHRVTWLVDNGHFPPQEILVVGPHRRFLDYVGSVLPALGTRNVTSVQLERLWDGEVRGTDSREARRVKSDERMAEVLRRRVEAECRPEAVDGLLEEAFRESDEPSFAVGIGSKYLRLRRSEVLDLARETRDEAGAYRVKRLRFRSRLVDALLRAAADATPGRRRDSTLRADLERHRQVIALVERVWPALSPEEALRSLLNSTDRLRECAAGILEDAEQAALRRPRAKSAADEPWTLDDLVCLEELRHLIAGDTPPRHRHIVVDEAQDLTPMQARSLSKRCPTGSMTVLGDLTQATGPHTYADWDRLARLLSGTGEAWRIAELGVSYRVPEQIMAYVAPVARAIGPELPFPTAVRRVDGDAVRSTAADVDTLPDVALARVRRLIGTDDRTFRSIAVIGPDDSPLPDAFRSRLDAAGDMTPEARQSVSVLAASHAKGMEFDHVVLLEPAAVAADEQVGLRLLYVALTRSTQTLTIVHAAPLPEPLAAHDVGTDSPPAAVSPGVGDSVRVRVLDGGTGSHRRVRSVSPAMDRPLLLVVRHGTPPPQVGSELDCWIVRQEAHVSMVSASDFGRRPIAPGTVKRYAGALSLLGELAAGRTVDSADSAARLSELRGLANRCLSRDQPDWLTVWRLLGQPDTTRLKDLVALTQAARSWVMSGDPEIAHRLRIDPRWEAWSTAFHIAGQHLRSHEQAGSRSGSVEGSSLTAVNAEGAAALDGTPRQPVREPGSESPSNVAPPSEGRSSEEIQLKPSTGRPDLVNPDAAPENWREALLHDLTAAVAADRNCNVHEAVRHELQAALLRSGMRPFDSPVLDVGLESAQGTVVYEVLGTGRTGYADLRAGAVRLHEVRSLLPQATARLYLVLAESPKEDWSADAVRDVLGVHVVWRTTRGWEGEDADAALGLG
ncbi:HelD family protein [Uniformispora flossi]|uniref:HelD family protein n=1 Tax=Uniformispora flossi TaxID=3390723 RepID=UPI003C2BAC12